MLEDYESGIRRKPSRHAVGRMRWILLASFVVNLFLFYKYWSNSTTIVILDGSNHQLSTELSTERKQIEHYKKQTMMTEERRANCEKRLSEIEDKVGECQLRHKDCSDTLETTSAKLMEMSQSVKSLTDENKELVGDLEKKSTELENVKEHVTRLQEEIHQYERNQNNPIVNQQSPHPQDAAVEEEKIEHDPEESKNQQTVKEVKVEMQNIEPHTTADEKNVMKQHEEKRDTAEVLDVEQGNDEPVTVEKVIVDTNEKTPEAFIECDFTEGSLDKGKCNYKMEPTDPLWEFGRPAFLKEHSTQCLYIDDSAKILGRRSNLVFPEIETGDCLQLTIKATTVGGGKLSVRDNDKVYEVIIAESEIPVWESKKFDLAPAPSHAIEISGIVTKYGGVGLTRVVVSKGECGPDIKNEVEFDDKVDEHDKEMLDDIA